MEKFRVVFEVEVNDRSEVDGILFSTAPGLLGKVVVVGLADEILIVNPVQEKRINDYIKGLHDSRNEFVKSVMEILRPPSAGEAA